MLVLEESLGGQTGTKSAIQDGAGNRLDHRNRRCLRTPRAAPPIGTDPQPGSSAESREHNRHFGSFGVPGFAG